MKNFWKPEYLIITGAITINAILHLTAEFHSGYHGDELLHIEAGHHLAAGYMDFPPVIGFLAFTQNLFHSDSIFVNHFLVFLASGFIFLLSGLIVIHLGGKWPSLLAALDCLLFSPGFSVAHSLFLAVVFEQLAWIVCLYWIVRYCNESADKQLIFIWIFAAVGFLTKYSILFLISGISISMLILRINLLRKKSFWIGLLIFILMILPNMIWQIRNGFPVLNHMSRLYNTQLDQLSFPEVFKSLVTMLNPLTAPVWIIGLFLVPFTGGFKKFRLMSFSLLFSFLLLAFSKGKDYYYFPIVLGAIPLGAVFLEKKIKPIKWTAAVYLFLLFCFGIAFLPKVLTIFSKETYIGLYRLTKNKDNRIPLPLENFYSAGIWENVLKNVNEIYHNLPKEEQQNCLIWGRHYSQACGINLLGEKYGLPEAFSFHSSCYCWVPEFSKGITAIVIADPEWDREHWLRFFQEVDEPRYL